jgi:hypothetical protein
MCDAGSRDFFLSPGCSTEVFLSHGRFKGVEPGKDRICRISHFEILSALDAYHFTEGSA